MKLGISMGMININRITFYSLLNDKARDLCRARAKKELLAIYALSMFKRRIYLPKSVSPETGHLH